MNKFWLGSILLTSPCFLAASCVKNQFEINSKITHKLTANKHIFDVFSKDQLKFINENYQPIFVDKSNPKSKIDIKFLENDIKIKNSKNTVFASKVIDKFNFLPRLGIHKHPSQNYFIVNNKPSTIDNYEFLFEKNDFDFQNPNGGEYIDLNSIFSRLFSSELNDSFNILNPNFIPPKWLRAKTISKNIEQIKHWENYIKLELLRYDFGQLPQIDKVKIFPIKHVESIENGKFKSAIIIKIDLQDKDGKSLISEKYRNQHYLLGKNQNQYLIKTELDNVAKYNSSLFKNYNSVIDFNNTLNIDDEELLFNEYANVYFGDQTILMYKNKLAINADQYEAYVNPTYPYEKLTARAFLWFLNNDQKYFELVVPEHRKNIDLEYKIINKKINKKYLNNTLSLIELDIEVTKRDLSKKVYKWYSIDINSHYHTFSKYKITPDLNWFDQETYGWIPGVKYNEKTLPNKVIGANEFYEKILLKLLSLQLYKINSNLSIFDNKIMANYEAHLAVNNTKLHEQLKTKLGSDIFKYLVADEKDKTNLLYDIEIKYLGVGEEPGVLNIQVDFLDKNKKSLLSDENRKKIIKWYGFKGTNYTKINEQIKKQNIQELTLKYLLENDSIKLKDQNNVIDYFLWGGENEKNN